MSRAAGPQISPELILRLQTTVGNRAVQRLLERPAPVAPAAMPASDGRRRLVPLIVAGVIAILIAAVVMAWIYRGAHE
jgi:hypothetical protein